MIIRINKNYAKFLPRCALAALPALGHVPQEESPAESLVPVAYP